MGNHGHTQVIPAFPMDIGSPLGGSSGGPAPSLSTQSFTDGDWMGRTIATVTPTDAVMTDDASGQFSLSGGNLRLEKIGTDGATYNPVINGATVPITCGPYSLTDTRLMPKMRINALDTALLKQDTAGTTPVTANSDPVGKVTDSISGWVFEQGTAAARPLYTTNAQNSLAGFTFDGSNDYWAAVTSAAITYLDAGARAKSHTIISVWNIPDVAANREVITWGTGATIHHIHKAGSSTGEIPGVVGYASTPIGGGLALPALGSPHIFASTVAGSADAPVAASFVDGVNSRISPSATVAAVPSAQQVAFTSTACYIGRRTPAASGYFKGTLLDILIYDRAIGAFEMQQIHKALGAFWNIPVTVNTDYVDMTDFDAAPYWTDDFTAETLNASYATDNAGGGWINGYTAGLGRSSFGTLGSIASEQGFHVDTRNALLSNVTSPYTVEDSMLKIQSAALHPDVGAPRSVGTGTITVTGGTATVTGSGTAFTTELSAGMRLQNSVGVYFGTVLSVTNDTSATLLQNTLQTQAAGSSFRYSDPSVATQYSGTGTLTSTAGSTAITGVGTSFLTELGGGMILHNAAGTVIGTIGTVNSDTSITFYENAQVSVAGAAFKYSNVNQDYMYMSHARISQGFKDQTYGRFEIRAKLPQPQIGSFLAFWLLGSHGRWPPEIDIFETFPSTGGAQTWIGNQHTDPYYFTNTGTGAGGLGGLTGKTAGGMDPATVAVDTTNTEHHLYGVSWTPNTPNSWEFDFDRKVIGSVSRVSGARGTVTISNAGAGAPNGSSTIYCDLGGTGSQSTPATATMVVSGGAVSTVTLTGTGTGGSKAQGWIDFSANLTAGDTITIGSTVFTAVASGALAPQFNVGATLALTLTAIVATIAAYPTTGIFVTSRSTGTRLVIKHGEDGGTAVALSTTSGVGTASGATLALMANWYTASTMLVPISTYGIVLTTDIGPDTVDPLQFHDPMYIMLALQLGALAGALNTNNGYPYCEIDYVKAWKYKPATPATLTRGANAGFDAAVDAAVADIITSMTAKGATINAAREDAMVDFVQAMMSWETRYDLTPISGTGGDDWDTTKVSEWDASSLLYCPFFAFDQPKAASKVNFKAPLLGVGDLSEVGVGITLDATEGALVLPGTAGVYLTSGIAIADTQFNEVDNGFEAWLAGAPTNGTSANLMGFNTGARVDVSATDWTNRMHSNNGPTTFITRTKPISTGHHMWCRGWRPMLHWFHEGELEGAGYVSGNLISAVTGSFKIGSYDGATQGAAFKFRAASVGRRSSQLGAVKRAAIYRAAMEAIGLTVP